jgi:hypothetical protein
MASTLTDGTYMIRFSTMPTKTGMYRYDVIIDNELVFIGNTYLEGNKNPIIDINDIVMNYNDPLHPKSYGTIAQKSKLLRTVKIKLYLDEPSEIESQVLMIYENPYYNSKVSTPILDNWATNSIGEMPMLQGWNYETNEGYFIPIYPAVASSNFYFDFVCSYQNMPMINNFEVKYTGGKIDSPKYVNVAGGGVYQYTLPLIWLLRGVNTTKTEYEDSAQIIKNNGYYSTKYEFNEETNSTWIGFSGHSSSSSTQNGNFKVRIGSKGTVAAYKVEQNGNVKSQYVTIEVTNDNPQYDSSYKLYSEFVNGNTTFSNEFLVFSDVHEQLLKNGPYKLHFRGNTWIDREADSRNPYCFSVFIGLEVTKDVIIPICEAKSLEITTFSPVNTNQRYTYTIANFDNTSRYFLKWKDRYGMPQCQPFGGTETYAEDFKKSFTTNYKNEKRLISIKNQPKWTLNSKHISQNFYPFYESIFVSPWLQLYDAKHDKLYDVVLTNNSYTEKTFNNQGRQLFNIQLEVELNYTENILY